VGFEPGVDLREIGRSGDITRRDPVNADIEGRERITRIDQRFIGEDFAPVPVADNADLTDAADPFAGRLDIDDDKIGIGIVWRGTHGRNGRRSVHRPFLGGAGKFHNGAVALHAAGSRALKSWCKNAAIRTLRATKQKIILNKTC
jgi:hypothetical protein